MRSELERTPEGTTDTFTTADVDGDVESLRWTVSSGVVGHQLCLQVCPRSHVWRWTKDVPRFPRLTAVTQADAAVPADPRQLSTTPLFQSPQGTSQLPSGCSRSRRLSAGRDGGHVC